jgi:hypothetical protein
LTALLLTRVILPAYDFLAAYRASGLLVDVRRVVAPETFGRIEAHAAATNMTPRIRDKALIVLSKLLLHTGYDPDALGAAEFDEFHAADVARKGDRPDGIAAAWDLLRGVGIVAHNVRYRAHKRRGQEPTTVLVDSYGLRCRAVRDVLVRYLEERRPALDFKSFRSVVGHLAGAFWSDIEAHHPDVGSLHLSDEVATAWKQRAQFTRRREIDPRPRRDYLQILMQVRSFYLDIQEWALQDPSWAVHAVPSPVSRAETQGVAKQRRKTIAAVHQRIRERLPRLGVLIETADRHRRDRGELLAKARAIDIGGELDHQGRRYRRTQRKRLLKGAATGAGPVLVIDVAAGETLDVERDEDDAFWAWALIETLRHTGVRLEELLEITHLALVRHRLEDTGELIPLLQVLPSKTDQERLLLVSPELASVLASMVSRLRAAGGGTIPLVCRYDRHERTIGPALPHLFQRRIGHRTEVIGVTTVQKLLNTTLARCDLQDAAGQPLKFTPWRPGPARPGPRGVCDLPGTYGLSRHRVAARRDRGVGRRDHGRTPRHPPASAQPADGRTSRSNPLTTAGAYLPSTLGPHAKQR